MPAEALYNNANVHDTKCQRERSPCCSALQLHAGRRTLQLRLIELNLRRWETNPTARMNVGDVHFCKLWICCSFTMFFFMLWRCCVYDPVRFRHKSHLVMVGKHCFLAWNTCFGHHEHSRRCPNVVSNIAGNCHRGFLKISSVLTLTNVETQPCTVVTCLAAISSITPDSDIKVMS